jgi:hypothetical protein
VNQLFEWHSRPSDRMKYMAPYFPVVQSSGMGKTKLLFELCKLLRSDKTCSCNMILCCDATIKVNAEVFDTKFNVLKNKNLENIRKTLNDLVHNNTSEYLLLVFDEAHHLLANDGFCFRSIRWWLREIRNKNIVAIFTGTNSQLVNYYAEPPQPTSSRDTSITYYEGEGKLMYDPFFHLHTIGCFRYGSDSSNNSEYDDSIQFGRPLFAVMHKKQELDDTRHFAILSRMLLRTTTEDWPIEACLSILATRVQMGQTSFAVASTLVAKAYANLTSISRSDQSSNIAEFAYLTDPVCARLAMCLMDDTWKIKNDGKSINGKPKNFWVQKMVEIFSTGLCRPSRGDVGELVVALYLLFCGDVLRSCVKDTNNESQYKSFSVSLQHWLKLLVSNNHADQDMQSVDAASTISFIQVCRNYLRFPLIDLMKNQSFLKYLYMSHCAHYVFPGCKTVDMIASIRIKSQDGSYQYRPLLISIKTSPNISSNMQDQVLISLKELFASTKAGGVGLLVIIDHGEEENDEDHNDKEVNKKLAHLTSTAILLVVKIPTKDAYGLTDAVNNMTTDGTEIAEIYTSHSMLSECDLADNDFLNKGLRKRTKEIVLKNYKNLCHELKNAKR